MQADTTLKSKAEKDRRLRYKASAAHQIIRGEKGHYKLRQTDDKTGRQTCENFADSIL